jgi:hypothetical protein
MSIVLIPIDGREMMAAVEAPWRLSGSLGSGPSTVTVKATDGHG